MKQSSNPPKLMRANQSAKEIPLFLFRSCASLDAGDPTLVTFWLPFVFYPAERKGRGPLDPRCLRHDSRIAV